MADMVQDAPGESLGRLAQTAPVEAPMMEEPRKPWLARLQPGYMVMLAILVVFPFVTPSGYSLTVLTEILVFGVFAMSLDLILGYTGLPSFGHAAFFGLGAYSTAILSAKLGLSNLGVTLLVTVALCMVAALILGWLAIRTAGVYFLMLTLAFAQMIFAGAQKWTRLTGGTNGLPGVSKPTVFAKPTLWTCRGASTKSLGEAFTTCSDSRFLEARHWRWSHAPATCAAPTQ